MICKFCLQEKKLIRCHIIPRSFFMPILDPYALIISNKPKYYPKKTQIGMYDPNLVCEECERLFSPFDNYAKDFLLTNFPLDDPVIYNNKKIAYIINGYDYYKLKLFFISLLWRASASSLEYFSLVNVGPFEENLKKMIRLNDSGDEEEFSMAVRRFEDRSYSKAILNPHKTKFDGINFVVLYLGGFTVFIKVDQRPSPDFMREIMLKPNYPLVVLNTDIRKTKEFPLIKRMAEMHRNKFEK